MTNELALLKLREQIKQLSPAAQLRLAASLLENGKVSLAEAVAGSVVDELRLVQTLAKGIR